MRGRLLAPAVVLATALPFAGSALARPGTTAPAKKITLIVVLFDDRATLAAYTQLGFGATRTLSPLAGPVPRGDYVSIDVFNRGKKAHDFTIYGKKTKPVKPGGKAHLFFAALRRGSFPYGSTTDRGRTFQGHVQVGDNGQAAQAVNPAVR